MEKEHKEHAGAHKEIKSEAKSTHAPAHKEAKECCQMTGSTNSSDGHAGKSCDSFHTTITVLVCLLVLVSFINLYGTFSMRGKFLALLAPSGAGADDGTGSLGQDVPSGPEPKVEASADDDPVKGDKNAPVTIVEFSDFECPFCGRWFQQTFPAIDEKYIKTGKANLIYRDFPLNFHTQAQKAAEASECADEQGKFWPMHDKLFNEGEQGGVEGFKKYAKDLGLDTGKFNKCLDSGEMAGEIRKDLADGGRYGVSGTPGFFINGVKVVGAQPFQVFEQVIEAELKK